MKAAIAVGISSTASREYPFEVPAPSTIAGSVPAATVRPTKTAAPKAKARGRRTVEVRKSMRYATSWTARPTSRGVAQSRRLR